MSSTERPDTPPLTRSLFDAGPPPPPPSPFNIASYCLQAAQSTPGKPALLAISEPEIPPEVWSFEALQERIERIAAGLQARGLRQGDRVALRLGNSPRFPLMFFAVAAAGGIAVPTSSQLTDREVRVLLEDCEPRFICADPGLELANTPMESLDLSAMAALDTWGDRLRPMAMEPDAPAYLVYTSGATGKPKGVLHAHRAAWSRRMMWADWYGLSSEDRLLHAGAFNWTYTLGAGLMDPWAAGATAIVYHGEKSPLVWPKLAQAVGATLFAAVPSVLRQILKYGPDALGPDGLRTAFASLRHALAAGEKLPETLRQEWRDVVGAPVYEALGMSECSTFISSSPAPERAPKPGFVGAPQRGRRVAVLPADVEPDDPGATEPAPIGAVGLLAVDRGDPGLMLGYWRRPEEDKAAARGPWFVTGDLAEMDADGRIAHHGRVDDVMNAMGYRVAAQEVEEVLAQHPMVAECAVAELQVRPGVSVIAGFVIPHEAAQPTAEALIVHCAASLAPYKTPREILFLDQLPRTANGKLKRRALAATYSR